MSSIVLKRGSTGLDVSSLQATLAKLGFKVTVDGDFGPETEAAVEKFQALNHLSVDGVVGEKTHEALEDGSALSNVVPMGRPTELKLSGRGAIDILSREGIALEAYRDSVGVWTIGAGRTAYDGKDPRDFGTITVEKAIELFKQDVVPYADAVRKTGKKFNQHEFDALVSFCYNVGPGNLKKLCTGRSIEQIGLTLMLYTKPPEITERRRGEQRLYQTGDYTNDDGKILVFPVKNNKPQYRSGYKVDVSAYFKDGGEG